MQSHAVTNIIESSMHGDCSIRAGINTITACMMIIYMIIYTRLYTCTNNADCYRIDLFSQTLPIMHAGCLKYR